MTKKRLLIAIAVTALACDAEQPQPEPPAQPPPGELPNVVIVTLDTTRADHLGLYGYFRDTSPRLDAFAAEAIVFDDALAPMATTLPMHTSLLTATQPLEHGVLANLGHGGTRFVPSPALRSFASVAGEAGYATGAFVSAAPLKRGSGIEQGFETFDEPAGEATARKGDRTVDAALGWLASVSAPFVLWVHTYDAHWPFLVPEDQAHRFDRQPELESWMRERQFAESSIREGVGPENAAETLEFYDTALRFQDAQLGRLLDALASREDWARTAVVIVADHGEGLSQHGYAAHGRTWHEHLHIPLVMRIPGQPHQRVSVPVSVVDVLPTLIPRLEAPAFEPFLEQASGRDVLAYHVDPHPVLSQDTGRVRDRPDYRFALTTPHWKYVRGYDGERAVSEQLYDRKRDPYELSDLAAERPEVTGPLRSTLETAITTQRARGESLRAGETPAPPVADAALRAQLCALGYVDEGCPEPEAAP